MKATFLSKEKNEAKFTMEFTVEELEQASVKAYQTGKDKFEVDGFRKGKAPRSIIETKYGKDVFTEDAVNELVNTNYPIALNQLNLDAIGTPKIEFANVGKGQEFTATVSVETYPEFKVKDYIGVEIEKIEGECTEEDINKEMESLQKRNARMVEIGDRAAENGDTVLLDYKGFVDDEQFEGGTAENFPLKLGSSSFIPGFEDQLIGVKKGEDRDVVVTFPEQYQAEQLAGKEATFKCVIHEIKTEELPALDDEFAKDTSELDTIAELRENTAEQLKKSKKAQAENKMKDNALGKVYEVNDIDVPEVMIEEEVNNMMNEFDQQLKSQGMDLQKYMEYMGKEVGEFGEELKEDAAKRVKTRMIVSAIADEEDFEVTQEEMDKELDLMATQYNLEVDKIKEMIGEQNIGFLEKDIKMRKAVEFIYDKAVIK